MARAQPLDPDARRAQLLEAARRVFAERGYQRASVSDVIKEAGVARGTFYNYFESKRAVLHAVLVDLTEHIHGVVQPIDVQASIPPQVVANVTRIVEALSRSPEVPPLLNAVGYDDEADEVLRGFFADAAHRVATALTRGQEIGVVRPGDTTLRARCLIGLVREPIFQAWLFGEELDVDALVVEVLTFMGQSVLVVDPAVLGGFGGVD